MRQVVPVVVTTVAVDNQQRSKLTKDHTQPTDRVESAQRSREKSELGGEIHGMGVQTTIDSVWIVPGSSRTDIMCTGTNSLAVDELCFPLESKGQWSRWNGQD